MIIDSIDEYSLNLWKKYTTEKNNYWWYSIFLSEWLTENTLFLLMAVFCPLFLFFIYHHLSKQKSPMAWPFSYMMLFSSQSLFRQTLFPKLRQALLISIARCVCISLFEVWLKMDCWRCLGFLMCKCQGNKNEDFMKFFNQFAFLKMIFACCLVPKKKKKTKL